MTQHSIALCDPSCMGMCHEIAHGTPRVSVILAVNRIDAYLRPAIASILDQAFTEFELLVIVDSGCQGLTEYVLECGGGDERIRIAEACVGGGVTFSRNLGLSLARGEYVAVMDGDDISRPERLQLQVRYLDAHPDVDVVGCRVQMIDQDSRKIERALPYFETNEEIRRALPYRLSVPHPAAVFRRRALTAVQGYRYGHSGEDYEMFIRMARNPEIKFYNLPEVVYEYRRHASQLTQPSNMRRQYAEISGFLYTEFLLTHSPKYLLGMLILHPWLRRARLGMRRWIRGSAH